MSVECRLCGADDYDGCPECELRRLIVKLGGALRAASGRYPDDQELAAAVVEVEADLIDAERTLAGEYVQP